MVQLRAAGQGQWRIGTGTTGSGESLASMAEVRALQMAQAQLAAACFRETHEATVDVSHQ